MIRVKEGLQHVTPVTPNRRFIHTYARTLFFLFSCSGRKAMNEKTIERKLTTDVRECGGIAVKLAATGISGMPDRLILLPGGRMAFVETKAPGKKPRALQEQRMLMLERIGFRCFVVDSVEKIREVLDAVQTA